jgi:hypothetical protein
MLGDAALEMPEIGVAMPLAKFYRDVDLLPPDTGD